ncbi:AAA family ATPase [Ignatzschineria sp. LJL83]
MSVKNLRSFKETVTSINLKRINLLVGQNSCGKSTFLRLFPLLRQSIETDTDSPILWFGKFVDFGGFDIAINSLTKDEEKDPNIRFCFSFSLPSIISSPDFYSFSDFPRFLGYNKEINTDDIPSIIDLEIGVGKEQNELKISMTQYDISIHIQYTNNGDILSTVIKDNNSTNQTSYPFSKFLKSTNDLLPQILIYKSDKKEKNYFSLSKDVEFTKKNLIDNIVNEIIPLYRKSPAYLQERCSKLVFNTLDALLEQIRSLRFPKYIIEALLNDDRKILKKIQLDLLALKLHSILRAINNDLEQKFCEVKYIGPTRASSERFYRHQSLQVHEIDHLGSNLHMVINSLGVTGIQELSTWLKKNLNFEVNLTTSDSIHYALEIKSNTDKYFYNINDMGFGYSQILPILVSIWLEIRRFNDLPSRLQSRNTKIITFAIEQPELHLHPELQYLLGKAISKIITNTPNINFILETHSTSLIDAVSDSILSGDLNHDLVEIDLFHKDSEGLSSIQHATFDENGYINNWPTGFLSANNYL